MDQGKLLDGDFYYRDNDIRYRFVSYENWTYETKFNVSDELLEESRIIIEFDGIDTISSIYLDDVNIGSTDNMFVQYQFDIKKLLRIGYNHTLSVRIWSAVDWSKKAFEKQLQDYEVPPYCVDPAVNGECHVNHIRKMQASFGWDWGPAFPNLGIWKPLKIVGLSSLVIDNILFTAKSKENFILKNYSTGGDVGWDVDLKIICTSAINILPVIGTIKVVLNNITYIHRKLNVSSNESQLELLEQFQIPKNTVKLWWPNGYGAQPLYNLTVRWSSNDEVSEKSIRVGFRTIELDQSFIDDRRQDLDS